MAYFKVLPWHLTRETEENHRKPGQPVTESRVKPGASQLPV